MRRSKNATTQPMTMIHHVREIQLRLLSVASVLIVGMIIGYVYYEPLFEFIRAPLNAPLHYMSPAGSFTFIIKICLMVGTIVALPVAVYNVIMFIQPALKTRLSRLRVYLTTIASLILALGGGAFGYLIILPLALRFFFKFQVNGLVAIISADEYFQFVIGVIVTFVIIFQLPLLMSLADHIRPLPPKKLLKLEKYIIVGSIFIGVVVPFALDPTVQILIASPIILLYNLSIVIILMQHAFKRRRLTREAQLEPVPVPIPVPVDSFSRQQPVKRAASPAPQVVAGSKAKVIVSPQQAVPAQNLVTMRKQPIRSMDGTIRPKQRQSAPAPVVPPARLVSRPIAPRRLITDMRPPTRRMDIGGTSPLRPGPMIQAQNE